MILWSNKTMPGSEPASPTRRRKNLFRILVLNPKFLVLSVGLLFLLTIMSFGNDGTGYTHEVSTAEDTGRAGWGQQQQLRGLQQQQQQLLLSTTASPSAVMNVMRTVGEMWKPLADKGGVIRRMMGEDKVRSIWPYILIKVFYSYVWISKHRGVNQLVKQINPSFDKQIKGTLFKLLK